MKELYITRHGQTVWNLERRLQGAGNSALTEKGIRDAERLAARLAEVPIDLIVTSHLLRAQETASLLKKDRPIPLVIEPLFGEMHLGEWEGRTYEEIAAEHGDEADRLLKGDPTLSAPGGETMKSLRERAEAGLAWLCDRPEETILLVTHGMFQSQLLEILDGHAFGRPVRVLPGTALSHFVREDDHYRPRFVGDTHHLDGSP